MRVRPLLALLALVAAAAAALVRWRSSHPPVEEYPTPPLVQRPAPGDADAVPGPGLTAVNGTSAPPPA